MESNGRRRKSRKQWKSPSYSNGKNINREIQRSWVNNRVSLIFVDWALGREWLSNRCTAGGLLYSSRSYSYDIKLLLLQFPNESAARSTWFACVCVCVVNKTKTSHEWRRPVFESILNRTPGCKVIASIVYAFGATLYWNSLAYQWCSQHLTVF